MKFIKGDKVVLTKETFKEAQNTLSPERAIFSFKKYDKNQIFIVDEYYGSNLMVFTPDGRKGVHYERFEKLSK